MFHISSTTFDQNLTLNIGETYQKLSKPDSVKKHEVSEMNSLESLSDKEAQNEVKLRYVSHGLSPCPNKSLSTAITKYLTEKSLNPSPRKPE